ncbi:hypothetical protein LEP1GSC192_3626 [Leptospira sp. B5-022]|nr:hypothetical protein LEP1GSC192_3626 [Leptospira sp. B5-022]
MAAEPNFLFSKLQKSFGFGRKRKSNLLFRNSSFLQMEQGGKFYL